MNRYFIYILRHFFYWISDKLFIEILFRLQNGRSLNLKNPQTFQEKIQWLKLYNRKPEYTTMVDKLAVKKYVSDIIGEKYIIPIIGVWDKFDDIDFESLPDKFVLKTTHGGGNCGVVVCSDKNNFDYIKAKEKINKSLHSDIYREYREWPYKNVPKRIIAEKYVEYSSKADLPDYKFFCFNGKPLYIQVIQDRNTDETIDFFDTEWNKQEFIGLNSHAKHAKHIISKPKGFEEMLKIATELSKNIPFVRVDLYQTDNNVYFGELTFYPASGFGYFSPNKWDFEFGKLLTLPIKRAE